MTVHSQEPWLVDGFVLNTLGYNIETFTGRTGLPSARGENQTIPYRYGRVWSPKVWDERTIILSMWVLGADDDGLVPVEGARAQFNENMYQLRKLFGVRHRLLALQQTKKTLTGNLTLEASAECVDAVEPVTISRGTLARFSVTLRLPDVYWLAASASVEGGSGGFVVANPGEAIAERMMIEFTGPLTNPSLTNVATGVNVRYNGSLGSGQKLLLDTDQFTANIGVTNVIGKIRHLGSPQWMSLLPGNNSMSLTNWQGGAVGAGTCKITYRPPYLS